MLLTKAGEDAEMLEKMQDADDASAPHSLMGTPNLTGRVLKRPGLENMWAEQERRRESSYQCSTKAAGSRVRSGTSLSVALQSSTAPEAPATTTTTTNRGRYCLPSGRADSLSLPKATARAPGFAPLRRPRL
ncbi:hypothetical protein AOLI_G00065060 [Acnodon oligacanthus]